MIDLAAATSMRLWAMIARRRFGELVGGADGHRAVAEAEADWLEAVMFRKSIDAFQAARRCGSG
jgi:hypothetical protein